MEPQQPVDRPVSKSGSALAARGPSANDPTTRGRLKGHITVRTVQAATTAVPEPELTVEMGDRPATGLMEEIVI